MRSVSKLTSVRLPRSHWLPPLVLAGLITILYLGTFRDLMYQWDTNIYYSHGYLAVNPIVNEKAGFSTLVLPDARRRCGD